MEIKLGKPLIKKILIYVWIPLSVVLTAIDLINLFEELWPAMIKWANFFSVWFKLTEELRDFLLTPITVPIKWLIGWTIPASLRSYFFIGGIFISNLNIQSKLDGGDWVEAPLPYYLLMQFSAWMLWPLFLYISFAPYLHEKISNREKIGIIRIYLSRFFLLPIVLVFGIILVFSIINYFILVNQ